MTFTRSEQWTSAANATDVGTRLVDALRARRAKIVSRDDGRIEAHAGSQLLARLDVSLVPKRWLPVHVVVTVTPGDDAHSRTMVAVELQAALGMGSAGTGSRYEELFDETVAALRAATP